jgi:Fe-S cluster biogenesis protein NfuA
MERRERLKFNPTSMITFKQGVGAQLKKKIPKIVKVEAVQ